MSQQTQRKSQTQAQEALKPVADAVDAGKQQAEAVVKAGNEAATKNYEQMIAATQEQVEKSCSAMFKGYDEVNALNKANIDAVVKSNTALAKGLESLGNELMAFAQSSIEANVATTKALFGAKTLREVADLQTDLTRSTFDKALAESAKVSEMSVKVANEALQPLQTQTSAAVERLFKPTA